MDTGEGCPLPSTPKQDEAATIRRLLAAKRIAIVGLSDDSSRPSYGVATYLQAHGFEVLPVNPNCSTVLGLRCYSTLAEVPGPIDLVDVFRRPQFCPQVVRDAIAAGAKAVWLQSGIRSPEAKRLAQAANLDYVEDRCLMVEHLHQRR
jgi:predicted CoA-binding protein